MENIYLIGMMGSGKSVTGRRLAAFLGKKFIDLDDVVEEKTSLTISDIFEKKGEAFFREEESHILFEASCRPDSVIATGGGSVLNPQNIKRMKDTGLVIYLETSPDTLWKRTQGKTNRPLLKAADPERKLLEIYHTRKPFYEAAANWRVSTDGLTPEAVAEEIYSRLQKKSL